MANLTPVPGLDNVVQLETTTLALGGPGAIMNAQAQALLNRIAYVQEIIGGSGEPEISKSLGYATWDGTQWVWKNETYGQPSENQTWTKGQRGAYVALTSSSGSIAVNFALSNNFSHVLTENTTLASPSNSVPGQSGVIHFLQGSSATYTLSKHAFWEFGIGSLHTMSTNLSGVSVMTYVIDPSGLSATCSWINKS